MTLFSVYLVFLSGYKAYETWNEWNQPVSDSPFSKMVLVPTGSSFSQVAETLEREGLIRSRLGFTILAWRKGVMTRIQAGEYKLCPAMKPEEILEILVEGKTFQHVVTIPEGYNIFQVADLLNKAHLSLREKVLEAAWDRWLLDRWKIPGDSVEGFLFPDTYYLVKGISARQILDTFIQRFWEIWTKRGFEKRSKEIGVTVRQVVTLASIVEKEAMIPRERPLIAAVFWNRLKKGMPLQADPTVKYIVYLETKGKRRWARWRHLRRKDNPYNTYIRKGLPKGPICNPGEDSIRAVLYPANVDYLYFVSMNNGRHYFSKTLAEHNKAVLRYQKRRYRRLRRKKAKSKVDIQKNKTENKKESKTSPQNSTQVQENAGKDVIESKDKR